MKRSFVFCIAILGWFVAKPAEARIIHVPADSSSIQAGIIGAVDGDTVLVARGHYYERIDLLGKGILVASDFVFDHDSATIDSTVIDADTSVLGVSDTGSVVVFVSAEDSGCSVIGFTIQNGIGTVVQDDGRYGGGIYCAHSRPTIKGNVIKYNCASHSGGGVCCDIGSRPVITGNTIRGNDGGSDGGISCLFFSSPTICGNRVVNNSAASAGGGIGCATWASPTIMGNAVTDNSAFLGGGISCMNYSSPTIVGNIVASNSATGYGGGISLHGNSLPAIRSNTIFANSAAQGGGIYCDHSSPTINSNIIASSRNGKGIFCEYESYPVIHYNNVCNNADGNFHGCPAGVGDTTWGGNFGGTPCDSSYNIMRVPHFADSTDFQLLCNSPCVDAGDPSICIAADSGGCRIDMGAREYLYILGDANSDGSITPKGAVTVGDLVFVVDYLFRWGPDPCPCRAADTNCDGEVNVADIVCLINYLFRGGGLPC